MRLKALSSNPSCSPLFVETSRTFRIPCAIAASWSDATFFLFCAADKPATHLKDTGTSLTRGLDASFLRLSEPSMAKNTGRSAIAQYPQFARGNTDRDQDLCLACLRVALFAEQPRQIDLVERFLDRKYGYIPCVRQRLATHCT